MEGIDYEIGRRLQQLELVDCVDWERESEGELQTVFKDGVLVVDQTLSEIRERVVNENFTIELH